MVHPLGRGLECVVVVALPRVLIAEDESQLLRVLVRVLEKRGYPVVSAADGKTAIDVLRKTPSEIDAIVLDAAIGPDGAGAVLEVLAAEQPQIRVILTSGAELSDSLRSRLRASDGSFLLKPFPPSVLVEAIERQPSTGVAK
jgi:CheY-like chemotaxis protein